MFRWPQKLTSAETVGRINRKLAAALAHSPVLEHSGWIFRCVECHVATGAYDRNFGYPWHSHDGYQIEIGLGGAIEFESNSGKTLLQNGEALVIARNSLHRWTCRRRGAMLGVLLDTLPGLGGVGREESLIGDIQSIKPAALKTEVDALLEQADDPVEKPFETQMLVSRLYLILSTVLRPLFPETVVRSKARLSELRGREQVSWMIHYLEENLGSRLRIDTLAREMRISERQIYRLFRKHAGRTLHEFLLDRRLERSRQLIARGGAGRQIKEVAFACGFQSIPHFSYSFRRKFGLTPSEFQTGWKSGKGKG